MVLDDITYDAVLVEVAAPSLRTKRLLERQRDALHAVPIPHILHPDVAEPHYHEVLDHLLPEVVIDPKQVGLVEVLPEAGEYGPAGVRVAAEWLLDDHAGETRFGHGGGTDRLSGLGKHVRRHGEVKQPVTHLLLRAGLEPVQFRIQLTPPRVVAVPRPALVVTPVQERVYDDVVRLPLEMRPYPLPQVGVRHGRAGVTVDDEAGGEESPRVEGEKTWVRLLLGEVAGGADDDDG
mmetsp:Transcript_30255/g.71997  ORF Transcript_30255/g.71997 Transcript_30255/m.71997 type:complete len:235 (-) Transcript_30255:253-957(-)